MKQPRYQARLTRQIVRYTIFMVLVFLLIFTSALTVFSYGSNILRAREHVQYLSEAFIRVRDSYYDYLNDEGETAVVLDRLKGLVSDKYMSYAFKSHLLATEISADMILTNRDNEIAYTTFLPDEISVHRASFNQIVQNNARKDTGVHNTVYYLQGNYSEYVFSRALYDKDVCVGVITLYLKGSDWNILTDPMQFDGIITDLSGRVIVCSQRAMVVSPNKFYAEKDGILNLGGQSYWVASRVPEGYGIKVYALVANTNMDGYYIAAFAALILILIVLLLGGHRFSKHIADINSSSLNALHDEISVIQKGDIDYRIELKTGDEFEDIAEHINSMVDTINTLGEKNLELTKLSAAMEMKQLEAQFDPHFLYNTLEIVRYAVRMDPAMSDDIIIKLTGLLRYSISGDDSDVRVEDDVKYLCDYLQIMCYRFPQRLNYELEITEQCKQRYIPRLILQPIVENAIKYGAKTRASLMIKIRGRYEENKLVLEVHNDGEGISAQELENTRALIEQPVDTLEHKGLHNIARRLRLKYGKDCTMQIESDDRNGTLVRITIPGGETDGL